MGERQLLIAGIDPGTTTAYALLDTEGKVVETSFSKNKDLAYWIAQITEKGNVIAVGTDKAKVPSFVSEVARKCGARIISAQQDLQKEEKRTLVKNHKLANDHESDALAAAFFAFSNLRSLIRKVQAQYTGKQANDILELVVRKRLSLAKAEELLKPSPKFTPQETKIPQTPNVEKYQKRTKAQQKEISSLKKTITKLQDKIKSLITPKNIINKTISGKQLADNKEKTIHQLTRALKKQKRKTEKASKTAQQYKELISQLDTHYLLKRVQNLGSQEFLKKKIDIKQKDMLLVEDTSVFSPTILKKLQGNVRIIVYAGKRNALLEKFPFIFLEKKTLSLTYHNEFALVEKTQLDQQLSSRKLLHHLVRQYQKERSTQLLDQTMQ